MLVFDVRIAQANYFITVYYVNQAVQIRKNLYVHKVELVEKVNKDSESFNDLSLKAFNNNINVK